MMKGVDARLQFELIKAGTSRYHASPRRVMLQHDQEQARSLLLTLDCSNDPRRYSLILQLLTIMINFVEFGKGFNLVPIPVDATQLVPSHGVNHLMDLRSDTIGRFHALRRC
jgi:hypothetical protein